MRKLVIGTAVILVLVGLAAVSTAIASHDRDRNQFEATLRGFEEVPAISTTARGSFTLGIHDRTLRYRLVYSGLQDTAIGAHIHFGQRGVAADVSAFLCGGGDKPTCTTPNGDIRGTIDPADVIGPAAQGIAPGQFAELVRAIRGGVTYANVHSEKFPNGEIRGQIHPD